MSPCCPIAKRKALAELSKRHCQAGRKFSDLFRNYLPAIRLPYGFRVAPPDARPFDISEFSRFKHEDYHRIAMQLPVLPIYIYYPGDYRSRDELLKQRDDSKEK